MSRPSPNSLPRLRAGCRLSDAPGQSGMLMIPEGALRLKGPGRKIVERCDGRHTMADIVADLEAEYPSMDPARIGEEVAAFLERLREKGVLEF